MNGIGTTWGWAINDGIFIFGWTVSLMKFSVSIWTLQMFWKRHVVVVVYTLLSHRSTACPVWRDPWAAGSSACRRWVWCRCECGRCEGLSVGPASPPTAPQTPARRPRMADASVTASTCWSEGENKPFQSISNTSQKRRTANVRNMSVSWDKGWIPFLCLTPSPSSYP